MRYRFLVLTLVSLFPISAFARQLVVQGEEVILTPSWGISSESAIVMGAAAFEQFFIPGTGTPVPTLTTSAERFCNGGDCGVMASVSLPTGALMTAFSIDACDTSATHVIDFRLARRTAAGPLTQIGGLGTTGTSATPGCGTFVHILAVPEPVNNQQNTYVAELRGTSSNPTTPEAKFTAFRVSYRLQVSQPPSTPTFTDVPMTHPFYQFIEALVASGITAGCSASPPQYCPDATLTRGQMAVFLARALGLHFPN